jgi:CspA family cold shock protein
MIGVVEIYLEEKGYGFIKNEDSKKIFFHKTDVIGEIPKQSDYVEFKLVKSDKGLQAINVKKNYSNKKYNTKTYDWQRLIHEFFEKNYEFCIKNNRSGLKGRIFSELIKKMFVFDKFSFEREVEFEPKLINKRYQQLAATKGRKCNRNKNKYIIDFLIDNRKWIEVTLNEDTAHKKTFKYAHQCDELIVIFLEPSDHIYYFNPFPNAKVIILEKFFSNKTIKHFEDYIKKLRNLSMQFR